MANRSPSVFQISLVFSSSPIIPGFGVGFGNGGLFSADRRDMFGELDGRPGGWGIVYGCPGNQTNGDVCFLQPPTWEPDMYWQSAHLLSFFLSHLSLYVSFSALHLLLSFAFGLREKRQACLEGKFLFLFHAVKLLILVIGDKTS